MSYQIWPIFLILIYLLDGCAVFLSLLYIFPHLSLSTLSVPNINFWRFDPLLLTPTIRIDQHAGNYWNHGIPFTRPFGWTTLTLTRYSFRRPWSKIICRTLCCPPWIRWVREKCRCFTVLLIILFLILFFILFPIALIIYLSLHCQICIPYSVFEWAFNLLLDVGCIDWFSNWLIDFYIM